ncbi:MAG: hypothetical protein Q9187_008658, partial [Circinaria calcarea]
AQRDQKHFITFQSACTMTPSINRVFDPDGDVVLVLTEEIDDGLIEGASPRGELAETSTPEQLFIDDEGADEMLAEDNTLRHIFTLAGEDQADLTRKGEESAPGNQEIGHCLSTYSETRLRVSSKHLILASPVFKAMLARNFKESATLRSTGTLELQLPDDDPAALLVLLDIIHGDTPQVPREVDLPMLTQLAVLVDKYQLYKVVGVYSEFWIDSLKGKIPQSFTQDLVPWISIFYVFARPTEFKVVTRIAQRESKARIGEDDGNDLPIPESVFGN